MGSLYSIEEAADKLKRSKRMVHNYIKMGIIRRVVNNKAVGLEKEDVDKLAIEMGNGLPPLDRKTFFELNSRIRHLEEKMKLVETILDIHRQPLNPTDIEAIGLLAAAKASVDADMWDIKEIDMWMDIFLRFDESILNTIFAKTGDILCWQPFFVLCEKLINHVNSLDKTFDNMSRNKSLLEAKKKLRELAIIWIELGHKTSPDEILKALGISKDGIITRLAKRAKTANKSV